MFEIWKSVVGFEGRYEVSNLGRVKSILSGKILKGKRADYVEVTLSDAQHKLHYKRVHRLVAEAFLDNPEQLRVVNHKNTDKHDNVLTNLEWSSDADNISQAMSSWKHFRNPVGEVVSVFNLNQFCKETGLDRGNLMKVLAGKIKSSKGWTRFIPESS